MAGGVIQGFTVKVQAATEAERVRAIMAIAVEGERSGAVLRALRGFPEVKAVHMTNGRWDMIAELNTDSLAGFSRALDAVRLVEGISATETSLLLTTHRM
jgi:DNA-binding Lrp family transcriptional regulator